MRIMTARYPGKCVNTGRPIRPGDTIVFYGKGSAALADTSTVDYDDPESYAGVYLQKSLSRSVSHIWNSGGKEYYRNKKGLCEDAPCCGCCNA